MPYKRLAIRYVTLAFFILTDHQIFQTTKHSLPPNGYNHHIVYMQNLLTMKTQIYNLYKFPLLQNNQ